MMESWAESEIDSQLSGFTLTQPMLGTGPGLETWRHHRPIRHYLDDEHLSKAASN